MPTHFLGALLLLSSISAAHAEDASDILGMWRPEDGGQVEIRACYDDPRYLCGYIRDKHPRGNDPHDGYVILKNLSYKYKKKKGYGIWQGRVYDPRDNTETQEDDPFHPAKIKLSGGGKKLELSGCSSDLTFICIKAETWVRIRK